MLYGTGRDTSGPHKLISIITEHINNRSVANLLRL